MKIAVVAGAMMSSAILIAAPVTAQQAPNGEGLFAARCKSCHDPAIARAPTRDQLKERSNQDIIDAMTRGVMQPMAAGMSPAEISAVAAFLTGRAAAPSPAPQAAQGGGRGAQPPPAAPPPPNNALPAVAQALLGKLRPVTRAMLHNPAPGDWLQWGRTYDGFNNSPLRIVSRANVKDLAPAWRAPLQAGPSMPFPLVYNGVMFLQTSPDTVLALDATTGKELWRHAYPTTRPANQKMGLALADGRVFVPTTDLHVVALNARTGAKEWDYELTLSAPGKDKSQFQLRSAPLVVGDKLIQGVTASGGIGGGYIVGLDIKTGREVWRFHTVPRPGEPGDETWNGLPLERRTGGAVWDQGTYDRELNLVFFGASPTYDTGPLLKPVPDPKVNNNALYTDATLAINPDTGKLVWYYQHLANDQWDLDWAFERQIATIRVDGRPRKVVMNVGKMDILDVLDARTGKYLFSIDAKTQNVITAIDPVTGAKTTDPNKSPDPSRPATICPGISGARAWPPTSFSPSTGMLYVPVAEWCLSFGPTTNPSPLLSSGVGMTPVDHPDAVKDGMLGRVQAMDVSGKKLSWSTDFNSFPSTGVLSTAGGLVFVGDLDPSLKAFDDRDGRLLWTGKLDANPSSNLITYSVGKTQYVAVVVGMSNNMVGDLSRRQQAFNRARNKPADRPPGGPAVVVFALP